MRQFRRVRRDKKTGVPSKYLTGARNRSAKAKEIKETASKTAKWHMVREKIEACLDTFIVFINSGSKSTSRTLPIAANDASILKQLCEVLNLTITQQHQLRYHAIGYMIRHKTNLDFLSPYFKQEVKDKAERSQLMKIISHELRA